MPLPKPKKRETKKEFNSRGMRNATMIKEFPKPLQRYSVLVSLWEKYLKG